MSRTAASKSSIQEEPRTVETLKNMLLNLNGVGPKDQSHFYVSIVACFIEWNYVCCIQVHPKK